MNFLSLIEAKRDGGELSPESITEFVRDFTAGKIPDYQMASMLMAVFFRGMNTAETPMAPIYSRRLATCRSATPTSNSMRSIPQAAGTRTMSATSTNGRTTSK